MDTKTLAEKEFKDLLAKYPTLQLDVVMGIVGITFKDKPVEIVAETNPVEVTDVEISETPIEEAPTVDTAIAQPEA